MKTINTLKMSTLKQYSPSLKGAVVFLVLAVAIWVWSQPAGQTAASPFHQWRTSQVVTAFESAGLQVEIVRAGNKGEDDGLSTLMLVDTARFRIPAAGETEGGIILSFYKADDLTQMQNYYLALNKALPQYSSWVFVKDNILVQINRSLPETEARQYEAALKAMGGQWTTISSPSYPIEAPFPTQPKEAEWGVIR